MTAQPGGLWDTYIFHPADGPRLILAAAAGDRVAELGLRMVHVAEKVETAPRKTPSLCMCCPRAVRKSDYFAVACIVPAHGDASDSIGAAICSRCATDEATLRWKVLTPVRGIAPGAREIDTGLHEAGHA